MNGSRPSYDPLVALVVDDRASTRYVVSTCLTRGGFRVVQADCGASAVEIAHRETIDVAVVDVHLPDMSGFEVCEALRAHPPTEGIAIVHLSATAVDSSSRAEGLIRGADAYLIEPVESNELLAVVNALVQRANLRQRALRTSSRLRSLNAATADVHAASSAERVFETLVVGASHIVNDHAMVIARSPGGATRWTRTVDGVVRESIDAGELGDALAPALTGRTTIDVEAGPIVPRAHVGAAFSDEAGDPIGAIVVPRSVVDDDEELLPFLAQLALTTTLALANLRALDIEHRIAVFLQASLLPDAAPMLEGAAIEFRYVAASQQARVGGDFYEIFALDETHVALAIGDVVGHSLHAATVMGEIRHAMRAYAVEGHEVLAVLARVERLLRRVHPRMYTSATYGVLDLARRQYVYGNAGHLPVVVVRADRAELIESPGSLLGIGRLAAEPTVIDLAIGDRVVLVTDGLIERRNESIDDGLERLRGAAHALRDRPLAAMVDAIVANVGPREAQSDDVAILAFEVTA